MDNPINAKARILVVDDSDICRDILCEMLRMKGYDVDEAGNGPDALTQMREAAVKPDLLLLDVIMPEMDGYQMIAVMKDEPGLRDIPVMFITVSDEESKGLHAGAVDYIVKPFDLEAVYLRVANQIELLRYRHKLEGLVEAKAHELIATKEVILETLVNMVEYRSLESGEHIKRTKMLTEILVKQLITDHIYEDQLKHSNYKAMIKASALHDIGKIGIPDRILLKPDRLTPEEFKTIETHTLIGSKIFEPMLANNRDEYFTYCYEIARSHHEEWNGSGYPDGLKGEQIPLSARILSLVDVYDALVSKRCYKDALTHDEAVTIIAEGAGHQFDPIIVEAFLSAQDKIKDALRVL